MNWPESNDRPSDIAVRAWKDVGDRIALTLDVSKSALEDNPDIALEAIEAEWSQEREDAVSLLFCTIWKHRSDVRSLVLNKVHSPIKAIRRVCIKAIGRHFKGSNESSLNALLDRISNDAGEDESIRSAASAALVLIQNGFEIRDVEKFIDRAKQVGCSESLLIMAVERAFGLNREEIYRLLRDRTS